ncbi:MAG: CHAP domain-containing protein [Rectinemataceae bacterium]|nr:CHAP domain-containing protein [Rectinemataceae bacterium]
MGAREEGGNNSGQWVTKYLDGQAPYGSSWCGAFVSWCYRQAAKDLGHPGMGYHIAARGLFNWMKRKGFIRSRFRLPEVGDMIFWWRMSKDDWRGHVGLVHHVEANGADDIIYTVEGNRSPKVEMFQYKTMTHTTNGIQEYDEPEMKKLMGYGRLPDFPEIIKLD